MRKLMKFLGVIQEMKKIPQRGIHPYIHRRLNPWNPLTYITILMIIIIGLIMFGLVGFWKEVDTKNPFSWR